MKFKAGEIVLLAVPSNAGNAGDEVEVVAVGPFSPGARFIHKGERLNTTRPADYVIEHPATGGWFSNEPHLRKKRPPEEPQVTKLKKDITRWTSHKRPVSA